MFRSRVLTDNIVSKPMVGIVPFLRECKLQGGDELIDLSIGNPDLPPCTEAIEELVARSRDPRMHGYGSFDGIPALKESIITYYRRRYGVALDGDEIMVIRGVRSMIFSIASIFAGPGDYVLVPAVAYPSYSLAADFCGAATYVVQMSEQTGYVPDLDRVPQAVLEKSSLLFLNYPNNPTGSVISLQQLQGVVRSAARYGFAVCYDNAYNEIVFDDVEPVSFLQAAGAKQTGLELFSLSKLASLAGWRIGLCAAGRQTIRQVHAYLSLTDTAPFDGFQYAAAKAIDHALARDAGKDIARHYQQRRDLLARVLDERGLCYHLPKGGLYMWIRSPRGDGVDFVRFLVQYAKVLLTPGIYYGAAGSDYVRISLTAEAAVFQEALKRLGSLPRFA